MGVSPILRLPFEDIRSKLQGVKTKIGDLAPPKVASLTKKIDMIKHGIGSVFFKQTAGVVHWGYPSKSMFCDFLAGL